MEKKTLVIDVNNLAHRAKHNVSDTGFKSNKMTTSYFDPFAEVDDSVSQDEMKLKVMRSSIMSIMFQGIISTYMNFKANNCVLAFDYKSWRKDIYPEYKANRDDSVKTPSEILLQDVTNEVLNIIYDYFNQYTYVTTLRCSGVEADDHIAYWCQNSEGTNIIMSADNDFKQLVSENTELYDARSMKLFTLDGVFHKNRKLRNPNCKETVTLHGSEWEYFYNKKGEREQCDPEWSLFEKCIRGDRSDNIRSSWPRVRSDKMVKAFNGTVEEYNNFINSTYGPDKISVREGYEFNKKLIDLTMQPDNIKNLMQQTLDDATKPKRKIMTGAYFAKFCKKHELNNIANQSEKFNSLIG